MPWLVHRARLSGVGPLFAAGMLRNVMVAPGYVLLELWLSAPAHWCNQSD
jgi:hypothetical protein